MSKNKTDYESPFCEVITGELSDVIKTSNPDFDGGQSGLSF